MIENFTNELDENELRPPAPGRWTEKARLRQACLTRRQKPWRNATGPSTPQGKANAKMNATKTGARCAEIREINKVLKEHRLFLKEVGKQLKERPSLRAPIGREAIHLPLAGLLRRYASRNDEERT